MSKVTDKWGDDVVGEFGFLAIPNLLLYNISKLGINTTDSLVLIFLLSYWWDDEAVVFPSSASIAKRIGLARRTIDRSLDSLDKKGLIINMGKIANGRGATVRHFDLSPVKKRLDNILKEKRTLTSETGQAA